MKEKPRALFLCHRIPFPPDKGDKIRSNQWFNALSEHYRLSLGAFVDAHEDWSHAKYLAERCEDVALFKLHPLRAKLRSLGALVSGAPLTQRYYYDQSFVEWVNAWFQKGESGPVVVYSSAMAQYVANPPFRGLRRVIDFVDVDADKWRQYAARKSGLLRWLYAREARCLMRHDVAVAETFGTSIFVSAAEADLFAGQAPKARGVAVVTNGVDHTYFVPDRSRSNPYGTDRNVVVFTGAMDYWPNVDAVCWFAQTVWPKVVKVIGDARFYVVGSRPAEEVRALAGSTVRVTGRVEDVRPYLQQSGCVVAPMRIARGIQNKVLEGMAMARPVVVTPAALEGLGARDAEQVLVGRTADEFAHHVIDSLLGRHAELGFAARRHVVLRHDWKALRDRFLDIVENGNKDQTSVHDG